MAKKEIYKRKEESFKRTMRTAVDGKAGTGYRAYIEKANTSRRRGIMTPVGRGTVSRSAVRQAVKEVREERAAS